MWVFTQHGFFSAVELKEEPTKLMVRSRSHEDIMKLKQRFPHLTVFETPYNDYRWRVIMLKKTWGRYLAEQAEAIDYPNFKNRVTQNQGRWRHDVYSDVWTVLWKAFRPKPKIQNEQRKDRFKSWREPEPEPFIDSHVGDEDGDLWTDVHEVDGVHWSGPPLT